MSSISFEISGNDPSANTTMNFRFQEFDGEVSSIAGSFDSISSPADIDVSAISIIYVKTEMMRKTFQFQTDATDIGDLASNSRDTNYYVFDASDTNVPGNVNQGAWRWDLSASESNSYFVFNPAHAMMDVDEGYLDHRSSGQVDYVNIDNPTNRQQNMIKQDFVRHIAKELFGSVKLLTLFNNEDDLLANIELGGINAWNNNIKPVLFRSRNRRGPSNDYNYGQNNNIIDQSNNLTRDMILQLLKAVPKRFMLDEFENDSSAIGKNVTDHDLQYYIRETSDIQPVPLMDGDTFIFKFKINGPTGQRDINGDVKSISDRTYGVKICLVGEDPINNYSPYNVKPVDDVYTKLDVIDYGLGISFETALDNQKMKYFIMGTEKVEYTYPDGVDNNLIVSHDICANTDVVRITLKKRLVQYEPGYLSSDLPGTFYLDDQSFNYFRVVHTNIYTLEFHGVIHKPTIFDNTSKLDAYIIYRDNPLLNWSNVDGGAAGGGAGAGGGGAPTDVDYTFSYDRYIRLSYNPATTISQNGNTITITWNANHSFGFNTMNNSNSINLGTLNSNYTTTNTNILGFTEVSAITKNGLNNGEYPITANVVQLNSAVASFVPANDPANDKTILTLVTTGDLTPLTFDPDGYIGLHL